MTPKGISRTTGSAFRAFEVTAADPTGANGLVETRLVHICAMLAYQDVSPEEIRMADYEHGRRSRLGRALEAPLASVAASNSRTTLVALPIELQRSIVRAIEPASADFSAFVRVHLGVAATCTALRAVYQDPGDHHGLWPAILAHFGLGFPDVDHNLHWRGILLVKLLVSHQRTCTRKACNLRSCLWLRRRLTTRSAATLLRPRRTTPPPPERACSTREGRRWRSYRTLGGLHLPNVGQF